MLSAVSRKVARTWAWGAERHSAGLAVVGPTAAPGSERAAPAGPAAWACLWAWPRDPTNSDNAPRRSCPPARTTSSVSACCRGDAPHLLPHAHALAHATHAHALAHATRTCPCHTRTHARPPAHIPRKAKLPHVPGNANARPLLRSTSAAIRTAPHICAAPAWPRAARGPRSARTPQSRAAGSGACPRPGCRSRPAACPSAGTRPGRTQSASGCRSCGRGGAAGHGGGEGAGARLQLGHAHTHTHGALKHRTHTPLAGRAAPRGGCASQGEEQMQGTHVWLGHPAGARRRHAAPAPCSPCSP